MTVQALPWAIQGQSHSAEVGRNVLASMFGAPVAALTSGISITTAGGAHGIVGAGDLVVAQKAGGANMSVDIAAGRAVIRSTEAASLAAGAYTFLNDAVVNVVVAAADPTNPRIDLVIAQVRDSNYSGANTDARLTVVTGTPAGSPVTPAVPSSCIVLAQVAVAAAAGSIINANITDKRTRAYALGGIAACTSTTRPSGVSLYPGLRIFETDTGRELLYDGTGFVIMSEPTVTSFVPTVTSGSGTITTLGAVSFAYHRCDGWLEWTASIAITTNGTAATNIQFTIPIACVTGPTQSPGYGRETVTSGKALTMSVVSGGTTIFVCFYDNTYPGATGAALIMSGRYRMTTRYS